jgi:hypothetical protein
LNIVNISMQSSPQKDQNDKSFKVICQFCSSITSLKRCLCGVVICQNCLELNENSYCTETCYTFHTGENNTTEIYNISEVTLPTNFEVQVTFTKVETVRTGITFNRDIILDQTDYHQPQFDIYCLINDTNYIYSLTGWTYTCRSDFRLAAGDRIKITRRGADQLVFYHNDREIMAPMGINYVRKGPCSLLIHCLSESEAVIDYIVEAIPDDMEIEPFV